MAKIRIRQHDITDCGAACLASVAAHYRLKVPISRIRQLAGTDKKGTNILGLLQASEKLGFDAKGVRGKPESLSHIPLPAIAHLQLKNSLYHFVVIYKVCNSHIEIMDPADGKLHRLRKVDFLKEWTGVVVMLMPASSFHPGDHSISKLNRFWFLLKPHKMILLQALTGAIVYTLLGFSTSIYIQKITDYVLVNGNINLLNIMSVVMLLLLVLQFVTGLFKDIFLTKTGQQIDLRLILGYYKHLLKLPQRFFDTMRIGEILSRISDAMKIRAFINGVSLSLTVNILIVLFSFALMLSYYWKLALLMMAVIPLYLAIFIVMNYLNKKTERSIMEKSANLESQLVESINAMETIKCFGLEDHANINTERRFVDLLKSTYFSTINSIFSAGGSNFLSQLFVIILFWQGAYYVIGRNITPGELMSFYAIVGYFTSPVLSLISANKDIQNALIAADRLFEIMDLEREAETGSKIELRKKHMGDIIFEDVYFGYGNRQNIFEGLCLRIPKGRITAVVGESGSGKSTLAALLLQLYPIKSGTIRLGNYSISDCSIRSLRLLIGYVPQQIRLFSGNVIENIAPGDYEPDMQRIIRIIKLLGLDEMIESLAAGYNTELGENGAQLSGGQRQRLAIARALYREPEILVLDEATSSLDSISEQYILECIDQLREKGKTIIMITHRLVSVQHADKIILMDKGKVKESGKHEELLAENGLYFKLWGQQSPGIRMEGKKTASRFSQNGRLPDKE